VVILLAKKLCVQSCWRCDRNGKEQRGRCNPIHFQGDFLRGENYIRTIPAKFKGMRKRAKFLSQIAVKGKVVRAGAIFITFLP
jgi:hypothetical protein